MRVELKGFRVVDGEIIPRHEIRDIPDAEIQRAMDGNALLSHLKGRTTKQSPALASSPPSE
jgi:hypothetical protein